MVTKRPKVSVIMPNRNYSQFILTAIDSVLNQTFSNLELIIVDNGSTDISRELIISTLADERIKPIFQEDMGQANSRNTGIQHSKGDFIAFLDSDDWWEPEKLELQLEAFSDEVGLVYSSIKKHQTQKDGQVVQSIESAKFEGKASKVFISNPGVSVILAGESTSLIRRDVAINAGPLNESLNSSSGFEFFWRCCLISEITYIPLPLVNYRIHGGNMSKRRLSGIQDLSRAYGLIYGSAPSFFSNKQIQKSKRLLRWRTFKGTIKLILFDSLKTIASSLTSR